MAACGAATGQDGRGVAEGPSCSGNGQSAALPWALVALVLSAQRRAALAADAVAAALEAPGRHAALLQRIRGHLLLRAGALPYFSLPANNAMMLLHDHRHRKGAPC